MKKILPIIISIAFIVATLIHPAAIFAQKIGQGQTTPDSRWVIDPEVTFIGKNARRSGDFLNWTLKNYNWVCVKKINDRQCDDSNNPIAKYWSLIVLYIVVPLLFVVILATSIVIIVTRGKSLTIMRFIPRFIAVVLLIVFSYSLLQFLYQFTDLIQGFFLRSNIANACPPECISDKDLLYVGWDYTNFVGLRLLGDKYAESAFISLLLTKLTALTYFVMVFLLLVRKIILWFFIIVSPIFPILLLYYPVRNTGKIWIGEFFRWLLYAPLFAIFLNGLVYLWRNQIPLVFGNPNIGNATKIEYPTAVNILLGGPKQYVTPTNSVNLVETFALYVVSLIMLWIVILLPWILLQIFLDYAQNFAPGDTAVMKTLVNLATSHPSGGGGSKPPSSTGSAMSMPFTKKFSIPTNLQPGPTGAAREINAQGATINANQSRATIATANVATANIADIANVNAKTLQLANLKLPSMRDIAKFDIAVTSQDQSKLQEVNLSAQSLAQIANPIVVTNTVDRERITEIREKIVQQSQKGNRVASSILNGANASSRSIAQVANPKVKSILAQMANPSLATSASKEKMDKLHTLLQKESTQSKSQVASSILSVTEKTSDKEVEKIKSQLQQSSHSQVSKSVTSAIVQSTQTSAQIQGVIQQVSNPNSVTKTADREQVVQLKKTLEKASKEGNQLASSILSVNEKTSLSDIEALQQRIQDAKDKGEPVAAEVAALANVTGATTLPMVNRVQTVKQEDYQAVKDMWKQNYQNLEVPQGMAGSRADWIKDDIAGIDETIGLLSSSEQDKVQQGMDQVSNLLPFLLVGGFSQTEIVSYLKAKQDAAKEVSKALTIEEEEKVSVGTKKAQGQAHMAATLDTSSPTYSSSSASSSSDEENESPLQGGEVSTAAAQKAQVSSTISTTMNLKLPKMQDIARFETQMLSKSPMKAAESEAMQNVIGKIANPSLSTTDTDKKRFTQLHESLAKASEQGNQLATEILSVKATTSVEEIEKLNVKLRETKDESASAVLSHIASAVPTENTLQKVEEEDYTEVQKMWEENYRTLPVPTEYGSDSNGRIAWITADIHYVEETISLLTATEGEKQKEGAKRVANIMPVLLLGGFSSQEVVGYLKAKLSAGINLLAMLQKEEESKVSVSASGGEKQEENTLKAEEEKKA